MEPTVKLILIAGGTASGKTIIADNVALTLKEAGKDVTLVSMDNYYKNYSELGETFETRNNINWDEPSAFRWDQFRRDIKKLLAGEEVERKVFNHDDCSYHDEVIKYKASKYIIIEGLFTLVDEEINSWAWTSFFINAPTEVRYERRLDRDLNDRHKGTLTKEVFDKKWAEVIEPMHQKHVEPTKEIAELVINNGREGKKFVGNAVKWIFRIIK